MNALAEGRKDVDAPSYNGTETELVRLLEAFRAFRDSVERVSRLRRTAEAAARTIRSTFRTMNEGIALFDPSGRPITMNRRVIALVGRSEEHTSELPSLMRISYAVFCMKKKNISKT